MMSYTDDVFSLSTLAHELGHSLHSYYTWQNQPFVYGEYSLFVAEVASNSNQAMVRDHIFHTQWGAMHWPSIMGEFLSGIECSTMKDLIINRPHGGCVMGGFCTDKGCITNTILILKRSLTALIALTGDPTTAAEGRETPFAGTCWKTLRP